MTTITIPSAIVLDPHVTGSELRLYALLAHVTPDVLAPRNHLAELLGCSVDSVDRSLRRLRTRGWVEVTPSYSSDGAQLPNRYIVREVRA